MRREDASVGDVVVSKINPLTNPRPTYKIVKLLKTVCWVELHAPHFLRPRGMNKPKPVIYRNVRYHILQKAEGDKHG